MEARHGGGERGVLRFVHALNADAGNFTGQWLRWRRCRGRDSIALIKPYSNLTSSQTAATASIAAAIPRTPIDPCAPLDGDDFHDIVGTAWKCRRATSASEWIGNTLQLSAADAIEARAINDARFQYIISLYIFGAQIENDAVMRKATRTVVATLGYAKLYDQHPNVRTFIPTASLLQ